MSDGRDTLNRGKPPLPWRYPDMGFHAGTPNQWEADRRECRHRRAVSDSGSELKGNGIPAVCHHLAWRNQLLHFIQKWITLSTG